MLKSIFDVMRGVFRWVKRSILLIGCIFFFTTNLLTLTTGFVQSALSTSLGVLGLSSVYSALDSTYKEASKGKEQLLEEKGRLSNSLDEEKVKSKELKRELGTEKSRTELLENNNQKLRAANTAKTKTITAKTKAIKTNKAAVKSIGGRVTRRTLRSAALNVGSIPFESAPFVGAGVVVVVTGYELHMACDSIDDMNEIYRNMGIKPDDDPGFTEKTCVGYIGQVDKLSEKVSDSFYMGRVDKIVNGLLDDLNMGEDDDN